MAASIVKWLILGFSGLWHPFYVSVTEINHNDKEKTLEIACKMFLDDTEKTLKKQSGLPVELTQPKDKKKTEQLLADYFKAHFKLKVDGKAVVPAYLGYEVEGASVWLYFQADNVPAVHKLEIVNNILYELYDNQISIMHASVGGEKKSTRITNPETNAVFEF
jgi:hypothetical protein